jgi:DNA invertase Pin-like site-specific DNA recombinase
MKAAIYARVSTLHQDYAMQQTELSAYAIRMGWEFEMYLETASGSADSERPEIDRLMADAKMKRFDVVLTWKVDRFGRSVTEFISRVNALKDLKIRFIVPNQGIDTFDQSPGGKMFMNMLAIFAEYERDIIVERVRSGMLEYDRAWAAGEVGKKRHSKSGKDLAPGRPKKVFRRDEASRLRAEGTSWREIARLLDVPQSTVRRALQGVPVP